jgi:thymidine kinase
MSNIPSELRIQNNSQYRTEPDSKYGEITVILGCMFAGKSSELIRQIRRYRSIGLKVFVIKHQLDDRYNARCVTSHDKDTIESVNVSNLNDILTNELYKDDYMKSDLVIIEEAQFFESLYEFVLNSAEKYGKDVIVAGLDGNFKREPFLKGELIKLIPVADNVYKLHGFCQVCRQKASFTKSAVDGIKSDILIGGKECYIPVCRKHYLN